MNCHYFTSFNMKLTIFIAKYFPRSVDFTKQFLGGNFHDTGLNTTKTPSRVHANYD